MFVLGQAVPGLGILEGCHTKKSIKLRETKVTQRNSSICDVALKERRV